MNTKLTNSVFSVICIAILSMMFCLQQGYAQSPQLIQFQGIALNQSGQALANTAIGIRINVLDGDINGSVVYAERHTATTGAQGVYQVQIGGGSAITGQFSAIAWGVGAKYVRLDVDASGGSNYTTIGTTQLVSVPYALYAERVNPANLPGGSGFDYAVRNSGTDTISLKHRESTFLPYRTYWFGGADESLTLRIDGLPTGVVVEQSNGSPGPVFSGIEVEGINPTLFIRAACQGAVGDFPLTLHFTSSLTNVQRSAQVILHLTEAQPIPFYHLNFGSLTGGGGGGCGDSGGTPPINSSLPYPSIIQNQDGKATLSGPVASRTSVPLPPFGLEHGLYYTSSFEITFQQPGPNWCGDPIPVTVPLQTITLSGDFGNTTNPPATTRTLQGTGFIRAFNGDWAYPEIVLDNMTSTENGVPCTTWQFYLRRS